MELKMAHGLCTGFPGLPSVIALLSSTRIVLLRSTYTLTLCTGFCSPFLIPSSSGIFPCHQDSSFILASHSCACLLPQALYILCSPLTVLWGSLSLTHCCIPVSYCEIKPDLLPAAPLGRDGPAIATKTCFAIKMEDPLSIVLCFLVRN